MNIKQFTGYQTVYMVSNSLLGIKKFTEYQDFNFAANLRSASAPTGKRLISNHLRRLKIDNCTLSTAPKWESNKEFSKREGIGKAGGDMNKPVVARRREGLSRKKKSVVQHLEQQE